MGKEIKLDFKEARGRIRGEALDFLLEISPTDLMIALGQITTQVFSNISFHVARDVNES
jgi:hypothetical protein